MNKDANIVASSAADEFLLSPADYQALARAVMANRTSTPSIELACSCAMCQIAREAEASEVVLNLPEPPYVDIKFDDSNDDEGLPGEFFT
jgi:hypothetical protein